MSDLVSCILVSLFLQIGEHKKRSNGEVHVVLAANLCHVALDERLLRKGFRYLMTMINLRHVRLKRRNNHNFQIIVE